MSRGGADAEALSDRHTFSPAKNPRFRGVRHPLSAGSWRGGLQTGRWLPGGGDGPISAITANVLLPLCHPVSGIHFCGTCRVFGRACILFSQVLPLFVVGVPVVTIC